MIANSTGGALIALPLPAGNTPGLASLDGCPAWCTADAETHADYEIHIADQDVDDIGITLSAGIADGTPVVTISLSADRLLTTTETRNLAIALLRTVACTDDQDAALLAWLLTSTEDAA